MALAEIQALTDLAEEMGIQEGPDFTAFLRDERARAREERQAENRAREQQQEAENRARAQQEEAENRAREQQQEAENRAREQQQEAENRAREQQQEAVNRTREQQQEAVNRDRDQKHALRLAEIHRETARETADRQDAIQMRGEPADRRAAMRTMPKLQSFDDKNDDMDTFIRRFESYAVSLEWPKDRWAINLSALSGTARGCVKCLQ